ncbi:hypothetical protein [Halobacillus salinus]|uniref:hypothetical protein n=1 Tax=Halobacillus salinus TaxID=192814 RepID=UPI0009A8E80B|nr:hypothetical protein [Halobacillus salinus]
MTKQKWLMIIGVLAIFAAGAYIATSGSATKLTSEQKPERKAKPVDLEELPVDWKEVESEEELEAFYTRHIPELPLAREKGVTTSPEDMMTVEGKEGRVQINEVLHGGRQMTFLFSMDLSLLVDEEENYFQPPRIDTVDIKESGDIPAQTLRGFSELDESSAIIFENRLYGILQTQPITKDGETDLESFPIAEPINAEAKTSLKINLQADILHTDPVPVSYQYDPEEHKIATREFEGTYSNDGVTIEPKEFVMSLESNYITLYVKSEDKEFNRTLEGRLQMDDRTQPFSPYLQPIEGEKDMYKAYFGTSPEVPEDIALKIRSIDMKENESFSFTFDVPELGDHERFEKNIDRTVAEKHGTDIYLDRLHYHEQYGMNFALNYRPQDPEQDKMIVGTMNNFNPEPNPKDVSVTTDNGQSGYARVSGSRLQSNVDIQPDLLEGASSATITFNTISVSHKIDHTFEISEDN